MPEDPFGLVYLKGRTSIFHRLDPISKGILLACVIFLSLFSIREITHLIGLFALIIVFQLACKPTIREFLRPQKILLPIILPFLVATTFTFALQGPLMGFGPEDIGYIDLQIFSLPYSKIGWRYGYNIFLRAMIVCMASLLLTWTTRPRDLVYTITHSLRLNYKLAWSVFLTLIYAPLLAYESTMIRYAQRVRGVKYSKYNIKQIITKYLLPLVVRGARKAFVTSLALDARAFGAWDTRTFRYEPPKPKYSKLVIILCIAVVVIYSIFYPPNPFAILTPGQAF